VTQELGHIPSGLIVDGRVGGVMGWRFFARFLFFFNLYMVEPRGRRHLGGIYELS